MKTLFASSLFFSQKNQPIPIKLCILPGDQKRYACHTTGFIADTDYLLFFIYAGIRKLLPAKSSWAVRIRIPICSVSLPSAILVPYLCISHPSGCRSKLYVNGFWTVDWWDMFCLRLDSYHGCQCLDKLVYVDELAFQREVYLWQCTHVLLQPRKK